jgi:signal transduction histidine kinase/ActR/RegA family two-component response regulator
MILPPGHDDETERLGRCIRDLAALTALPSLCVGRTPREVLDILIDALPTALTCDLVYFTLPAGGATLERGWQAGAALEPSRLAEVRAISVDDDDGAEVTAFVGGQRLWCMEAEIALASPRGQPRLTGRLLAGRREPLDASTDRVLVRTAANLIGTSVDNASVLEAARGKDDFLAMLGHELRNPLAPIITALELLKQNPTVGREQEVIARHTQHLVRIVDDLLDISRVTRGHIELRREPVSLASVLERAVEMVSPLVTRNRHQLTVAGTDDAALQGDPVRLAQIFGNLLTNAAKFTPPGGRIDVTVGRAADRVQVIVADNGCGIAEDQLQRIFEPFVQADRERDSLRGGLGLGLAIVRNLVERHGGSISVRSGGRGQGANFAVELPTITTEDVRVSPPPAPLPSAARAQVRVLIVDDNTDIAELLAEALNLKGFQTAVANDGHQALITWRQFLPHAGVLDVGLPGLDGYQLARAIRVEHGNDVVLIAMTGYGQPSDRVRSAEAGFDSHLVKPVSLDELVRVLDERTLAQKS